MEKSRNIVISIVTRAVVCVAVLGVAVGVFTGLVLTRPSPPVVDRPRDLRRVTVMSASTVAVHRQWSGYGTARATDSADVPAEVTGVVSELPETVVVGSTVARGDVLARLDDTDYRQRVEITTRQITAVEARLTELDTEKRSLETRVTAAGEERAVAQAELQRVIDAFEKDAAKQREIDQARSTLNRFVRAEALLRELRDRIEPRRAGLVAQQLGLEAELALAEKNLGRCVIRSPLDGILQMVDLEIGEAVTPAQPVARVVDLSRIEVPLRLPSSARPSVGVGDPVTLTSQGLTVGRWEGVIGRIAPEDDATTRTMTVYVDLEQDPGATDTSGLLASGRFVRGMVTAGDVEMRTVVPRRSVVGDRLLTVVERQVVSVPIEVAYQVQAKFPGLGVEADQWVVLATPLAEGMSVIVNASRSMFDGLLVEAVHATEDLAADGRAGKAP